MMEEKDLYGFALKIFLAGFAILFEIIAVFAVPGDAWAVVFGAVLGAAIGAVLFHVLWGIRLVLLWLQHRQQAASALLLSGKVRRFVRRFRADWQHQTNRLQAERKARNAQREHREREANRVRQEREALARLWQNNQPATPAPQLESASSAYVPYSANTPPPAHVPNPLLSATVSAATGSFLLGWMVGGSIGGAMLGDMWHDSRKRKQKET